MALYKITKREVETAERTYRVEGSSEEEALRNWSTPTWEKIYPQTAQTTKHIEVKIELEA